MASYTWVLDQSAVREVESLQPSERRRVFEFLDTLARHPFQEGHLRYRDNAGFEIRVYFLGEFDIHYRLDHAVLEVRVAVVERHPPLEL